MNCLTCKNKDICKYSEKYLEEEKYLSEEYDGLFYMNCNEYIEEESFKRYLDGEWVGNESCNEKYLKLEKYIKENEPKEIEEKVQYRLEYVVAGFLVEDIFEDTKKLLKKAYILNRDKINYEIIEVIIKDNKIIKTKTFDKDMENEYIEYLKNKDIINKEYNEFLNVLDYKPISKMRKISEGFGNKR